MPLDAGDWIAVIAAVIALASLVISCINTKHAGRSANAAERSAEASKASADAAERSAAADEQALQLAKGHAVNQQARWVFEKVPGSTNVLYGTRSARIFNTGNEVALNVRISGERLDRDVTADAVHHGDHLEFSYQASESDPGPRLYPVVFRVTWNRPEEFGGEERVREFPIQDP